MLGEYTALSWREQCSLTDRTFCLPDLLDAFFELTNFQRSDPSLLLNGGINGIVSATIDCIGDVGGKLNRVINFNLFPIPNGKIAKTYNGHAIPHILLRIAKEYILHGRDLSLVNLSQKDKMVITHISEGIIYLLQPHIRMDRESLQLLERS